MLPRRDPAKVYFHDRLLKPVVWFIPSGVLPNHLTVLRFFLVPIVLYLLAIENYAWGVPLFTFAAFTDVLDGTLARLRKQISAWGTFYDPIADKLLIGSVAILVVVKYVTPVIVLVLLSVEALIILGGLYRRRKGRVDMANWWGKWKMVLEFTGIVLLLISLWMGNDLFFDLSQTVLIVAIVFAVISLLTYSL